MDRDSKKQQRSEATNALIDALTAFLVTLALWCVWAWLVWALSARELVAACIFVGIYALLTVTIKPWRNTTTVLSKIAFIVGAIVGIIVAFKLYQYVHFAHL
jgi:hypothetical protein